ncbi:MAG: YggS family pyridoxal phosphate-dependent enzyme [Acidobacteria bacterium]|nr:YggS family pyridoxal phosphate-dependent enzyme [Acidobacteriota bacterium]
MPTLKKNLKKVLDKIADASARSGRPSDDVKLVAVSKTHTPDTISKAVRAGILIFGENKVQEAEEKIAEIGHDKVEWHLIGHLQKNKARKAVQLFDVIHSLDSPELAHRLERICEEESRSKLSVFVQVDLAGEKTKSGVPQHQLNMLVEVLKRCQRLSFDGLMTIPPMADDPEETRQYFRRLRELRDRLAEEGAFANGFGHLSMGMSHDFEVAIEEGATIVRVGTAIFGERS